MSQNDVPEMKATRAYVEALMTGLAHENPEIHFEEVEDQTWSINVDTKTLRYTQQTLSQLPPEVVKGLILHESGHLKFTDVVPIPNNGVGDVYNAFEDMRIEHNLIKKYGNFGAQAIAHLNGYSTLSHEMSEREKKERRNRGEQVEGDTKLRQFLTQVIEKNIYLDGNQQRYVDVIPSLRYLESTRDVDVRERLHKINIAGITDAVKRAQSTREMKNILDKYLIPLIQDYIDAEPEKKDRQPLPSPLPDHSPGGNGPSMGGVVRQTIIPRDEEIEALYGPYITTLARKLSDILKERSTIRFTGARKVGKLLSKNAFKVITGDKRLFSRRNNPHIPHYVITMMLDESGSMVANNCHYNTYIASYVLKRACDKLKFQVRLIQYGDRPHLISQLSDYRSIRADGNMDADALEYAYKLLNVDDDNIIFHLTDGGFCQDVQYTVNKIIKDKKALVIGVGIQTEEVKKHFKDSVVVPTVEKLPMALLKLLTNIIHR